LAKLFDERLSLESSSSSPLMILSTFWRNLIRTFSLSEDFFCFSNVGIFDHESAVPVEIVDSGVSLRYYIVIRSLKFVRIL